MRVNNAFTRTHHYYVLFLKDENTIPITRPKDCLLRVGDDKVPLSGMLINFVFLVGKLRETSSDNQ